MNRRRTLHAAVTLLGALAASTCFSGCGRHPAKPPGDGGMPGDDGGTMGGSPYEPVSPQSYVAKVKNLMTGLAPTDAEVQAVVADPTALKGLVDQWMALPQFQYRMLDFFRNAFQQNQVSLPTLSQNIGVNLTMNEAYQPRFERSLMDSFPLTVWQLVSQGRPLTEAITTNRYMMTTAMMSVLAYVDELNVDDKTKTTDRLAARTAVTQFTLDPKSTATLTDTLNPASPNYMVWPMPVVIPATCTTPTPLTFPGNKSNYGNLFGELFGKAAYAPCYPNNQQQRFAPQFADNPAPGLNDWNDWRLVTVHALDANTPNTTPVFWDIVKLRAATDMTLHTPRMGFFGTLAFAANWATNVSNEARVTANQALIVAIGQSINGANTLVQFPVTATDAAHAQDPACAACHTMLDPYKQFFRQSYSLFYHDQLDSSQLALPANFNIDGVTATGQGVGDLAKIFIGHPRFALAWAQKLQFWANSTAADETDPELLRIADAFQKSNFDFKTLVRELFSSPLITLATATQTTSNHGVTLSISRRDQYCSALANRLGLPDVCGMITANPTAQQKTLSSRALLLPVDTYYRAYELPSLPTNPDLFFRTSTESMCSLIADQLVDVKAPAPSRYSSARPTDAIADFVATVMALVPSDPRSAPALKILTDHFAAAQKGGATATDALKSTFTLACIAPSSVIVGL